jgi:hypothetical protein
LTGTAFASITLTGIAPPPAGGPAAGFPEQARVNAAEAIPAAIKPFIILRRNVCAIS